MAIKLTAAYTDPETGAEYKDAVVSFGGVPRAIYKKGADQYQIIGSYSLYCNQESYDANKRPVQKDVTIIVELTAAQYAVAIPIDELYKKVKTIFTDNIDI